MRSTITLNGKNSSEIEGLLIQSLPPISKPLMRTQIDEIDGRDGDIVTPLGFSAYTKEITIGLYGDFDINEIISYFNSKGTVTFSNEPDMYYNYQIISQIDFERLIRYRTATVSMHCQPFKYSTTEGADILSSSDNFATLNQSLNTDASLYTYTSNVQDDVTATRTTAGTGGKFFAVFTIPVVQGITYYFSGNVASNVTMYAYTDTLRGTNAGIAGKPLKGDYAYTATFTGTMVLGFYSSVTNPVFIRNFFVTNEEAGVISGEGNDIVLEGTSEAPFLTLTAKGDTYQQAYSGYNLIDLVPITNMTVSYSQQGTKETVMDSTLGRNVLHFIANNTYPSFYYTLPQRLEPGKYYALKYTYKSTMTVTQHPTMWFAPNPGGNPWDVLACLDGVRAKSGDGDTTTSTPMSATWKTTSRRFYVDPNTYSANADSYKRIVFSLGYNSYNSEQEGKELWLADAEIYEITEDEWNASTYTSKDYEPYTAGPSPNPDYPQDIQVVTGEQTVTVTGKNLCNGISQGYWITSTAQNAGVSAGNSGLIVAIQPNTNYTVSTTISQARYRIAFSDEVYSGISLTCYDGSNRDGTSATITSNSGLHKYLIVNATDLTKIQIEQGSTATTYEPYQSQDYTVNLGSIELAKIGTYQDYIYKNGEDWYVHKEINKVVLDGTESNWYRNYAVSHPTGYSIPASNLGIPRGSRVMSTHWIYSGTTWNGIPYFGVTASGTLWLQNIEDMQLDVFKAWLASNNPVVYHILATPTDTKITDSTLIEQLEALKNNSHAYKGRTYIKTNSTSSNLPHIIEAAVAGNMDGTVTNSGNTTARPKLTIFGSGNIGISLNGNQIFNIALGDEGHITIDTNAMEAYQDTTNNLKNRLVTGDYSNFVLQAGDNQISFSGNATMCVVENYSRWL